MGRLSHFVRHAFALLALLTAYGLAQAADVGASPPVDATPRGKGYLVYCPCMGQFGNQVAQLLGAMAAAKESGRVLVLPPFIEYGGGQTRFVPFERYFSLAAVREYVDAVTLEQFLADQSLWPPSKRRLYCARRGAETVCPEPQGNPQRTFWERHGIAFAGSNAVETSGSTTLGLIRELKAENHPVLAFSGSPGSFPEAAEDRPLQRYLVWSEPIRRQGEAFIAENLVRPYLAIHLRNGSDWEIACKSHGIGRPELMSSPQCGLSVVHPREPGLAITEAMCIPGPAEAIRAIQDASKKFGPFSALFIGTDNRDYRNEIAGALPAGMRITKGGSPVLDLYVFAQADLMIGNCVSSFSALAIRERQVHGKPSVFFGF